jgi:hypothetical protein
MHAIPVVEEAQQSDPTASKQEREELIMRLFSVTFAGFISLAAVAMMMVDCNQPMNAPPPNTLTQACPPGVPFVDGGYANGKWVPAHCQGYAAQ